MEWSGGFLSDMPHSFQPQLHDNKIHVIILFSLNIFSGTVNSDSQLATLSAERKVSETRKMLSQSLFNPSCGMVGPALGVYVTGGVQCCYRHD